MEAERGHGEAGHIIFLCPSDALLVSSARTCCVHLVHRMWCMCFSASPIGWSVASARPAVVSVCVPASLFPVSTHCLFSPPRVPYSVFLVRVISVACFFFPSPDRFHRFSCRRLPSAYPLPPVFFALVFLPTAAPRYVLSSPSRLYRLLVGPVARSPSSCQLPPFAAGLPSLCSFLCLDFCYCCGLVSIHLFFLCSLFLPLGGRSTSMDLVRFDSRRVVPSSSPCFCPSCFSLLLPLCFFSSDFTSPPSLFLCFQFFDFFLGFLSCLSLGVDFPSSSLPLWNLVLELAKWAMLAGSARGMMLLAQGRHGPHCSWAEPAWHDSPSHAWDATPARHDTTR